ncbi:hypothetical protein EFN70_04185 [Pediococcus ethanolidurans]|uniref:hypothetical protein n=1 Tax=Pediococcus ethanolidurans TaxID=319653 RepID=UPI0021AAC7D9|nr:hypothetical protein [Pediococcus ethanolidurans]MCT4397859.1 hypothetical protein [Pediococcus ethanolidurans]
MPVMIAKALDMCGLTDKVYYRFALIVILIVIETLFVNIFGKNIDDFLRIKAQKISRKLKT